MSNTAGNGGWNGGYYWINVGGEQINTDYLNEDATNESVTFSISGICPDEVVTGCTDPEALNYNANATEDDGSCFYPEPCDENNVLFTMQTGPWGNEINWQILNSDSAVVASGGNYPSNQVVLEDICLEDGCYTMEMFDSFGDGWNGAVIVLVIDEETAISFTLDSGSFGSMDFGVNSDCGETEDIFGCTDPEALNYNANATEDDGSCFYPEPCDENNVLFTMQTGPWGNEINWQILNSDSAVVASGGNYPSNQVVLEDICLEDGCYTMEMFDSFGDGWNGAVIVLVIDEETAISFTLDSGSFGSMDFGVNSDCGETEDIFGCTDPEALNYNANATEDDGSCFYPEPCDENNVLFTMQTGPWGNEINWQILNSDSAVVASGGNYPSNQVVLEDICLEDGCYTMEMFDSFGDGWNEAVIVLVIDEETAISFTLDSGSFGSIDFGVNSDCGETEDIFGCTDPEALNYNWLATIDDGSCFYPGPFLGPSLALTGQDVDIEFNFAPNPVENVILLTFGKLNPTQRLTVDIYDAVGRLVVAEDFGKTQEFFNTNINLESLESGAYIIVASNGASKVTERLIKQ
jgi:hypothetical protein